MRELVRGYAARSFEAAGASGQSEALAKDLTEMARVLEASSSLRDVLTSAQVDAVVRSAIVADLVSGKTSSEGAALLGFLAWAERPSELASSLIQLVTSADTGEFQAPLASRSALRERIAGYAERVFEGLRDVGAVAKIEDELFEIGQLMVTAPQLRKTMCDSSLALSGRRAVLSELIGSTVQPATFQLVSYVIGAPRLRDLVGMLHWLVELAAAEQGRRIGEVRSVVALDEDEIARIGAALTRLVRREVEVRVIHDESVIGGLVVAVGDLVIDGSVKLRLENLTDLLGKSA